MKKYESKIHFLRKNIIKWGKKNYKNYPWRNTDNSWHALSAEVMLQRTKAEQVVPVFQNYTNKYKSPSDFLKNKNEKIFKNLGLHWREEKLIELAEALGEHPIPTEKHKLMGLPAVGDYISAAYRSFYLNLYDVIIDSNIVRVYGRFFGFKTDNETRRNKDLKFLAKRCTPKKNHKLYNYGILDFSRNICKTDPDCETCPIAGKCKYFLDHRIIH